MSLFKGLEKSLTHERVAALRKAWDFSTSANKENWTHDLPEWGQSAITALIIQEWCGGKILCISLEAVPNKAIAAMGSHYYNEVVDYDGVVRRVDMTQNQFGMYSRCLTDNPPTIEQRTREYLLSNENTRKRYELLKARIEEILKTA